MLSHQIARSDQKPNGFEFIGTGFMYEDGDSCAKETTRSPIESTVQIPAPPTLYSFPRIRQLEGLQFTNTLVWLLFYN
ncbi:hypothetical protein KIN20_032871 [Parelaphostrongylus tenuis]|uniref:Uncharacterized protein n=1 Tax=Parelaphostrongylus tenuis TaxID=148309 RepID=A0AAD5R7U9_PARTN|nr:hypothetical protein KIN20_032871 [Parelaphostrongylus tenuis]